MSQSDFGNLSAPLPGIEFFNDDLEPWRDALHTSHSGTSRPAYAVGKMIWLDTTSTPWIWKCFDGTDDITIGTINATTNLFTPANALADGDKGDIIVSSSGTIWALDTGSVTTTKIADNAVTLAKLATMAANTVLVNATTGSAVPTALALLANQVVGRQASGNILGVPIGGSANNLVALDGSAKIPAYDGSQVTKLPLVQSFAISDESTTLTTGTGKLVYYAPVAFTISSVFASVGTVSSSGLPQFDITKNGTSIFSTKPTIDASENTTNTAATASVLTSTPISVSVGDKLSFDISGAGTGAKAAKLTLIGNLT